MWHFRELGSHVPTGYTTCVTTQGERYTYMYMYMYFQQLKKPPAEDHHKLLANLSSPYGV